MIEQHAPFSMALATGACWLTPEQASERFGIASIVIESDVHTGRLDFIGPVDEPRIHTRDLSARYGSPDTGGSR